MSLVALHHRTPAQVEQLVHQDYLRYRGKAIMVQHAIIFVNGKTVLVPCDPPLPARIDSRASDSGCLLRWDPDGRWCDPLYPIHLLQDGPPELRQAEQVYVNGPARGVNPVHDEYSQNQWAPTHHRFFFFGPWESEPRFDSLFDRRA